MSRQYMTLPFNPSVAQKQATSQEVARLLGETINQAASQGWLFQSYETIEISVNPGCLTFMQGPKTEHHRVLIFFRDV